MGKTRPSIYEQCFGGELSTVAVDNSVDDSLHRNACRALELEHDFALKNHAREHTPESSAHVSGGSGTKRRGFEETRRLSLAQSVAHTLARQYHQVVLNTRARLEPRQLVNIQLRDFLERPLCFFHQRLDGIDVLRCQSALWRGGHAGGEPIFV